MTHPRRQEAPNPTLSTADYSAMIEALLGDPPKASPAPQVVTTPALAQAAARSTPAQVGVGRVGTRPPTERALQAQAELALAQVALDTELPEGWMEAQRLLPVSSRARSQREHLRRPDLGRSLDEASVALLRERAGAPVDLVPVLADGLSAGACMNSGMALLDHFTQACIDRGLLLGPRVGARFARVQLGDEVGELLKARVVAVLLGEQPGPGGGEGLSACLVYAPRPGRTQQERNVICNIHPRGLPPQTAAERLSLLAVAMIAQQRSGQALDLRDLAPMLGDSAGPQTRPLAPRPWLIERG